ncbi:ABC-three component system middle component 2 [Brachybacterium alimentarium]|uniref:ABC-three component system middle component 2 n=1 Tax=Brachybacterium alimentarium TaxID=47845 RepID=UPI003FD5BC5C
MGDPRVTQLLNSPLEVGVRVVAMLNALYPRQADLSRIVLLDHVALHSEDFSGAESLHPAVPVRIGELGMKRELVRQGIILMGVRGLIVRNLNVSGIYYGASDDARPFLESIDSAYLTKLRRRCAWAATEFGELDDETIRMRLGAVFGSWAEEFDQMRGNEKDD